jgi:hypothetical protein
MREDFYSLGIPGSGTEKQQVTKWLDRAVSTTISSGSNIVGLTQNTGVGPLAPLRVSAIKVEADNFQTAATRNFTPIPVQVEATLFAQEGSWFVIPMPVMHRNDIDSSGGPLSPSEQAAATRFRHLNYSISVTGNIIQHHAPTALFDYDNEDSPDAIETTVFPYNGAIAQWVNAVSFPTRIEPAVGTQGRGRDWQTISYSADLIPVSSPLVLPPSPDLSYSS